MAFTNISTVKYYIILYLSVLDKKTYSDPRRKFRMKLFAKIVHSFRRLTVFVKSSILDVGLGSKYASADSNPLLIFWKTEAADLFSN